MIFSKPHMLTELEIWRPRYHDKYREGGEYVVLLAKYKVDHATRWIRITFTKAKHLEGQRYCVDRDRVERCDMATNGKIACYVVPFSMLESWESSNEIWDTIRSFGW